VRVGQSLAALSLFCRQCLGTGLRGAAYTDNDRHIDGFCQFRAWQAANFDVMQLSVKLTYQCIVNAVVRCRARAETVSDELFRVCV